MTDHEAALLQTRVDALENLLVIVLSALDEPTKARLRARHAALIAGIDPSDQLDLSLATMLTQSLSAGLDLD